MDINRLKYIGLATLAGAGVISLLNYKKTKTVNENDLVIITGCDSGLGYTMAVKCKHLGMSVVACVLNKNSEGAIKLKETSDKTRFFIQELDLKNSETISNAYKSVLDLFNNNKKLKLYGIINNAGIMVFGEFEWQTESLIKNQIEINLIGTIRFTHEFLPLARKFKSRIITVTSHCGLQSLSGLAPYAASKAGLKFWNDSLRIELKKYGVSVINFIPGSFHAYSNIAANQQQHFNEMKSGFNDEQKLFYGEYFQRYEDYLKLLSYKKPPTEIPDAGIVNTFVRALLDDGPKAVYKCEPLRYSLYHMMFHITPIFIQDWLVEKFVSMPRYRQIN